ncbi:MAG: DUF58 domain-containing protein [Dehalococcoidia bacterium]
MERAAAGASPGGRRPAGASGWPAPGGEGGGHDEFQGAPPATSGQPEAERILHRLDWRIVRRLDGLLQGDYRSLFTGHGLDLAEVREYQPQDDVRYMDWNVTARMGTPYVRQYLEDREITAWLLLDLSGSVEFGTASPISASWWSISPGRWRGCLPATATASARCCTGGVDHVLPAGGGRRQIPALLHLLTTARRPRSSGPTDLTAVLDRAAQTICRRSLVFVVSDFIAAPGWDAPLRRLTQRHEVVAVWLRDPREEDLPDVGPLVLEDAETGEQLYVDTHDKRFRRRFRALARERQERLTQIFARHGIDVLTLSTDRDVLGELARFALRRREARGRLPGVGPRTAPDGGWADVAG